MRHHPELSEQHFEAAEHAASAGDCTGLIPRAPISESELDAYEDVYHYLPPEGGDPLTEIVPPSGIDPAPKADLRDRPPVSIHDSKSQA